MWSVPRLSARLRHVPHMRSPAGLAGRAARCQKGVVVMVNDPIADMLTRIRNAVAVGHERVAMPASKVKGGIARILVDEGFIDRFDVKDNGAVPELELVLRYGARRQPAIGGIKRISKPGHRIY